MLLYTVFNEILFLCSKTFYFRLYSNELDTTSDFPAIYRQENNKLTDEELLKLLSEYRKPDKLSKLTVIPGSLKIKISSLNEIPESKSHKILFLIKL